MNFLKKRERERVGRREGRRRMNKKQKKGE